MQCEFRISFIFSRNCCSKARSKSIDNQRRGKNHYKRWKTAFGCQTEQKSSSRFVFFFQHLKTKPFLVFENIYVLVKNEIKKGVEVFFKTNIIYFQLKEKAAVLSTSFRPSTLFEGKVSVTFVKRQVKRFFASAKRNFNPPTKCLGLHVIWLIVHWQRSLRLTRNFNTFSKVVYRSDTNLLNKAPSLLPIIFLLLECFTPTELPESFAEQVEKENPAEIIKKSAVAVVDDTTTEGVIASTFDPSSAPSTSAGFFRNSPEVNDVLISIII